MGVGTLLVGWVIYDFLCRSALGHKPLILAVVLMIAVVVITNVLFPPVARRQPGSLRHHLDQRARRVRMLGDVVERFLCDPVEGRLDLRGQAIPAESGRVQIGSYADPDRPVLDVVGQRCAKAEVIERRWTKLPHQVVDVAVVGEVGSRTSPDLEHGATRATGDDGAPSTQPALLGSGEEPVVDRSEAALAKAH